MKTVVFISKAGNATQSTSVGLRPISLSVFLLKALEKSKDILIFSDNQTGMGSFNLLATISNLCFTVADLYRR